MKKNDAGNGEQNAVCSECGASLKADMQFCTNCGTPIPEPPVEAAPKPVEAAPEPDEAAPEPDEAASEPDEAALEPTQPPVEYAQGSDMPFPDAPAQAQTTGYRNETLPRQSTNVFVGGLLGFIVLAALLIAAIVTGLFSHVFFAYTNMINVFVQLLTYGALACGIAMTSRAKGPDISMGAVAALTGVIMASMGGSWIIGLVLAFLVCAAIGAINGILIVFLRIPSLIMTIVVAAIIRGVVFVITNGRLIEVGRDIRMLADLQVGGIRIIPLAIFAGAFLIAFFVILFSRLGKPLSKREVKDNRSVSYFVAYLLSSIIAFFVGVFLVSRFGGASPTVGNGYEIFIILCFAVITSSRFMDNRGVPVVFAVLTALLFALISNVLYLNDVSQYWHQLIVGIIALAFVVISYIARKDSLKGLVHRV